MSETTVNNGKLFARIAQVMGKVRSLPKDGHNKQSNYNYVSNDTALEAIGKAMAEFGVIVIPSIHSYETVTDGKMTRCKIEVDMHIGCADGDTFTSRWISEGIDYGNPDKALTKAITYATKTFLIKLFVVGAGGEDPDSESAPDDTKAKEQPQVKQLKPNQDTQHRQLPPPAEVKALAAPEGHPVGATISTKERAAYDEEIGSTFLPDDIDDAQRWLIKRYTAKATPGNMRLSPDDLTVKELTAITKALKTNRKTYQDGWANEKAPVAA